MAGVEAGEGQDRLQNPGQWPKGRSGNPTGKGKPKPEEPDGLTEAGRMRAVWGQPKDKDCNSEQRNLRALLERSPSDYRRMMREAELEEEAKVKASASEGGVIDEGEARVRELINELLAEASEGARRAGESEAASD